MSRVFDGFGLAGIRLSHRFVMAPVTRARAPLDAADELHDNQCASTGLVASEGTPISPKGQGDLFDPGIYGEALMKGGRLTMDSVHAAGYRSGSEGSIDGALNRPALEPQR